MNRFKYKVLDQKQVRVKGEVEARDIQQAAMILRNKNFLILELGEVKASILDEILLRFQRPQFEDVSNFTRQLSTMIASGLPLVEALRILRDQSKPSMARVVGQVAQDVEGGVSLADSMAKIKEAFDMVYVALVRVGESAGVLDRVLKKMAETLEKQREFRSKVKGAMVYPAIVLVGMVVVGLIMMIFVVPKMTEMYRDFGAELPTPTKILIGVSDFLVKFWWLALGLVFALGVLFSRWAKTELGALMLEKFMFRLPILGKLRQDIILTEFARTMGMLVGAGISVLDGLRIVADTMGSRVYRDGVIQAALQVEKGSSLAESLADNTAFPPVLGQMVAVGEQTGKVDETLLKLADFYEEESATKVKALTTAIEPLIMVVMGVGVGFLVFAVIMPIYNLTSQF